MTGGDSATAETGAETGTGIGKKVAILVPCHNEALTIEKVVQEFRDQCPEATLYVYDNASSDQTASRARDAGAVVRHEGRRGKGYVMRSMFREVDADIYVMVDGDDTYPAERVRDLMAPIVDGSADMVIGSRIHQGSRAGFSRAHLLGNKMFRFVVNTIFRIHVRDLLSGYRAMNRRVVKGLPLLSRGFEIETELTVKCLVNGLRVQEVPVDLTTRPEGSESKIRLVSDGILILQTLFSLLRDYKPLTAFGAVGLVIALVGLVPGIMMTADYFSTGQVPQMLAVLLVVGLVLAGTLVIFAGLVLHTIARRFQELDVQIQRLTERRILQAD
jgi:glycosyltransferase involved in cell wall biosynthesis